MKKVSLVYPPITKKERYSSKSLGAAGGEQIPLGIYYLASFLEKNNYNVQVIDAEAMCMSEIQVLESIKAHGAIYVGISSTTVSFHRALALANLLKQEMNDVKTILGGVHVTSNAEHAMSYTTFDYGALGEGEKTLLELLECLELQGDISQVNGIVYRENEKLKFTDSRAYIENLDILPFPAYHLIDDISIYAPPPSNYRTLPVINIITSRGCPNQCTFCDKSIFKNSYRERSAQNVFEELKYLRKTYQFKEIAFVDDTFLINKKRIHELFDLLDNEGIRFYWTCMSRINNVDRDYLEYLYEHGCWHISFGIESADEKILETIKKNISIPQAHKVIAECHDIGIMTKGFFIIGHPGETLGTINKTISLAKSLKLDDIVVTINTPIPGSVQYETASEYGTFDKTDWSQFNYWRPVFVPKGLEKELLLSKQKELYIQFYARPKKIIRYVKSLFGKGGIKRLKSIIHTIGYAFSKNNF